MVGGVMYDGNFGVNGVDGVYWVVEVFFFGDVGVVWIEVEDFYVEMVFSYLKVGYCLGGVFEEYVDSDVIWFYVWSVIGFELLIMFDDLYDVIIGYIFDW